MKIRKGMKFGAFMARNCIRIVNLFFRRESGADALKAMATILLEEVSKRELYKNIG